MKHVLYQGQDFVLSRTRNGMHELVNSSTGDLILLPEETQLQVSELEKSIVPKAIPFLLRPRQFLSDLRQNRNFQLRDAKKVRAKKSPSDSTTGRRTKASRSKNPAVAAANAQLESTLSALSPEQAEAFRKMMKGKL